MSQNHEMGRQWYGVKWIKSNFCKCGGIVEKGLGQWDTSLLPQVILIE